MAYGSVFRFKSDVDRCVKDEKYEWVIKFIEYNSTFVNTWLFVR